MPISDLKFGEKKSVTSCPIWRSGQPMIFVFDDLRSMGTYIQLVTTISLNFFRRSMWMILILGFLLLQYIYSHNKQGLIE